MTAYTIWELRLQQYLKEMLHNFFWYFFPPCEFPWDLFCRHNNQMKAQESFPQKIIFSLMSDLLFKGKSNSSISSRFFVPSCSAWKILLKWWYSIFSRLFGFMRWFEPICEGAQSVNHGALLKKVSESICCYS